MGTDSTGKEKKHGFWKKVALVATTAVVTVLAVKNWDSITNAAGKVGKKVFTKKSEEGSVSVEQQPEPQEEQPKEQQPRGYGYNNNNRNNGGYYNKPRN